MSKNHHTSNKRDNRATDWGRLTKEDRLIRIRLQRRGLIVAFLELADQVHNAETFGFARGFNQSLVTTVRGDIETAVELGTDAHPRTRY